MFIPVIYVIYKYMFIPIIDVLYSCKLVKSTVLCWVRLSFVLWCPCLGVLYFAGHGFETHPGNCYLVPSDSPTQSSPADCVSSRKILNSILAKNPALCLVVLDICRVRYAVLLILYKICCLYMSVIICFYLFYLYVTLNISWLIVIQSTFI